MAAKLLSVSDNRKAIRDEILVCTSVSLRTQKGSVTHKVQPEPPTPRLQRQITESVTCCYAGGV
jgi:hypothetical protein